MLPLRGDRKEPGALPDAQPAEEGKESLKLESLRLIEAVKPTPEFDEAMSLCLRLERMKDP